MTRYATLLHRYDAGSSLPYALIRVFLGLALFVRGWVFIGDQEVLMGLLVGSGLDWFMPALLVHYITLAHLVGGVMLVVGLLTRAAALSQVPILVGAVFFVHGGEGLFAAGQSLELAALVLVLLVVVTVFGAGELSMDYWLRHRRAPVEPAAEAPLTGLPPDGVIRPHGSHHAWDHEVHTPTAG